MANKKCSVADWSKLPSGFELVAVSLNDEYIMTASAFSALQFCFRKLVRENLLSKELVRKLGFSWLGINPTVMSRPAEIGNGIYVSLNGSGSTPLMRISLILKRIRIPQDRCVVEYAEAGPIVSSQILGASAKDYLVEWDPSRDEPDGAVQKRIYLFVGDEVSTLSPYKVSIGGNNYVANGWLGFANAFIAYIFLNVRNGPKRLLDLQYSDGWKYGDLVRNERNEISILPVEEAMSSTGVLNMILSLMNYLGFDKYSVSVNCVDSVTVSESIKGQPNQLDEPVHDEHPVEAIEAEEEARISLAYPEEFRCERHLRPAFSVTS